MEGGKLESVSEVERFKKVTRQTHGQCTEVGGRIHTYIGHIGVKLDAYEYES